MMSINVIRFTILTYFTSEGKYNDKELIQESTEMLKGYLIEK